ncbi:MAG: hypothetical protein V3T23_08455 [Nitrososphaerales archaeon]
MLTSDELEFFTKNKDRILDLIRAVDQHENIRAIIGPGQVLLYPHLAPDYERSHDLMSRLSAALREPGVNVGPLNNHDDLPKRFGISSTVVMSC